jgi:hypothetical protein
MTDAEQLPNPQDIPKPASPLVNEARDRARRLQRDRLRKKDAKLLDNLANEVDRLRRGLGTIFVETGLGMARLNGATPEQARINIAKLDFFNLGKRVFNMLKDEDNG